jgi:hypothetical protein
MIAGSLLPLWEGGRSVITLVERWLQIRPLHPVTLQPVDPESAFREITQLITNLEYFLYVLVEKPH